MPESRQRRKAGFTPPPAAAAIRTPKHRPWIAPVMCALFILGLVYLVIWYLDGSNRFMDPLGGWNIAIGFAFFLGGFALATQWR